MTKRRLQRAARDGRRMTATGAGLLMAAAQANEMMDAAQRTIAFRTDLMRQAADDPIRGDHRELARMGHEKLEAASTGGWAVLTGWNAINRELASFWQSQLQAGMVAASHLLRCRTPAAAQGVQVAFVQGTFERSTSSALRLAELTTRMMGASLHPYHGRATRNARRLERAAGR